MVDQIAQVAVETLRDLLIEEARFLSGVSNQVEEIQRELTTIHCFLKDADARPDRYDSQIVRNWVVELKDLASSAEDVLETYTIEVISKKIRGRRNLKQKLKRYACILGELSSVHQTGKEIESIRSRMADLTKQLESMSSSSIDHAQQQQKNLLRQTFAHEFEEHFVGMEKDIDHLVKLIKDDEGHFNRAISICGMGGLGKTTLARKIYHHKDVQSRFDSRAWICISQQFQPKKALQEILKQILQGEGSSATSMAYTELVSKLYDVLKQKKCFIVIDDIWKADHWNILKKAFPIAEVNCKVLVTTRNEEAVSEEHVYKLDHLTEDQGWELIQKIALSNVHSQELKPELTQLEAIGRVIVEKCGCLPLAISVIGGNLRGKQTLSEWKKVSDNMDTYLKYGEGVSRKDERVKQVLDLSYNVLPYYLKPCFLYLGCFGEDEEIDTEKLYLLWMAEGLISFEDRGSNETLRDVAQRYLSELALRCVVQVQSEYGNKFSSTYNKFVSCRLHDLMRDLCLSKGQEERFIKVMQFSEGTHYSIPSSLGTIRRLAILQPDHLAEDNLFETENLKRLRSLLLRPKIESYRSLVIVSKLFVANLKKMKFLRILKLEYCDFGDEKLPSEVGKLMHLRYLSLFKSRVKELPMSICELPNLHTLDLRVSGMITLHNVIYKMKRLRHLFLEDWSVSGDEMLILDGLKELETLVLGYHKKDPIRIADLPTLTNLQLLEAVFLRDVESIVDHMDQLREATVTFHDYDFSSSEEDSALLKKIFMCDSFIRLGIYCPIGSNFPCYQPGMSTNLVELTLSNSMIEGDVIKVLGKFPMLKSLILKEEAFVDTNMICRATDFPQLRVLSLWDLRNLEKWEVEHGAMPNLSSIVIFRCGKLKMIPEGLAFITTLQKLLMPRQFKERIRGVNGEPGPDYHKVSHIPHISVW